MVRTNLAPWWKGRSLLPHPHSVLSVKTVGVGTTLLHVQWRPSQLLACKYLYADHAMRRLGHPIVAVAKSVSFFPSYTSMALARSSHIVVLMNELSRCSCNAPSCKICIIKSTRFVTWGQAKLFKSDGVSSSQHYLGSNAVRAKLPVKNRSSVSRCGALITTCQIRNAAASALNEPCAGFAAWALWTPRQGAALVSASETRCSAV